MSKKTTGMLLGKFMPPHAGHCYLIDSAYKHVDKLSIVVGTLETEPIPGKLRFEWVKSLYPNANVIHLDEDIPQDPSEHPNFWNIWQSTLLRILDDEKLDYVFASEDYGEKLAEVLGAKFIAIDIARETVPVSATAIRANPYKNWQYIPKVVRPYYTKRICIIGPESTGKTTLAVNLAQHFETTFVPEFARIYLEGKGRDPVPEDMYSIALGQINLENSLIDEANKVMICDTDPLTTFIWDEVLFGTVDSRIKSLAQACKYDLYLLLAPDVPWVEDTIRYTPNSRNQFYEKCKKMLNLFNRNYIEIGGDWQQRFTKSCKAIEDLTS